MWAALTLLLWLLATALLSLLLALALPLRIELRASAGEALRYSVALRPFGLIGPRVSVADSETPRRKKWRARKKNEKREQSGKTGRRGQKRIAVAALRLIVEILDQVRIDKGMVNLRFGAHDPAETGAIYGYLTPLIYGPSGSESLRMTIEPVFDQAIFEGRAALDLTLTPARIVPPFVRFGWAAFGPRR